MIDLDLGMNQWMTNKFIYPDRPMDRGKILWEEDLKKLIEEKGQWGRYLDLDGDGIPYRTVPGNLHPRSGYFTRGTGHNEFAKYDEDPENWEKMMNRLSKKIHENRHILPEPEIRIEKMPNLGLSDLVRRLHLLKKPGTNFAGRGSLQTIYESNRSHFQIRLQNSSSRMIIVI